MNIKASHKTNGVNMHKINFLTLDYKLEFSIALFSLFLCPSQHRILNDTVARTSVSK